METFFKSGQTCPQWVSKRPPENCWSYVTNRSGQRYFELTNVFWPYDRDNAPHHSSTPAGPFMVGDYVRIVGTLWEDFPHGASASGCWASGKSAERGYAEIHPVDFMARIPPPRNYDGSARPSSGLNWVNACSDAKTLSVDLFPPEKRPAGAWKVGVNEVMRPDFTTTTTPPRSISATAFKGHVDVQTTGDAKFAAVYKASWVACQPSCTGRCGVDDGCGTTCGCPSGQACNTGRCCPNGQIYVDGHCCAPCACGNACASTQACVVACKRDL
jgi:hypothetical protein